MMGRANHALLKPQSVRASFNLYLLFLNVRHLFDRERELVNRVLMMVAWRARTPDEYEPDPTDVHPIGSANVTIRWAGLNWHIEDFLMLLVDVDNLATREEFLTAYEQEQYDRDSPDIISKYHYYTTEVLPNEHTTAALEHPLLKDIRVRHFLQRYLFWLAIELDTRIERIACKMNTTLLEIAYDCPAPIKVKNMRNALRACLLHYAYGYCTEEEFSAMILDAYTFGFKPTHEPDAPAIHPEPTCIFVSDDTCFQEHIDGPPWLVIRDPHIAHDSSSEIEDGDGDEDLMEVG